MIRQLREENEKLKDELQILRELTASDSSIHEELSAIMRDRINDLLVANSDLEKEVVRLRYSPKEVITNYNAVFLWLIDFMKFLQKKMNCVVFSRKIFLGDNPSCS